jgi:hypothetical protein
MKCILPASALLAFPWLLRGRGLPGATRAARAVLNAQRPTFPVFHTVFGLLLYLVFAVNDTKQTVFAHQLFSQTHLACNLKSEE